MLNITRKPATCFFIGRRNSQRPSFIVLDVADGSLLETDVWFETPRSEASTHYMVSTNGQIHQYVNEESTAYHSRRACRIDSSVVSTCTNDNSIGIWLEGKSADPSPLQWAAVSALIREVSQRNAIPIDLDHILSCGSFQRRKIEMIIKNLIK